MLLDHNHPDAHWSAIAAVSVANSDRGIGVSAVAFDMKEELLWVGNSIGYVTSFYGAALEKHSSFRVHLSNEVRQVMAIDAGILSLTRNSLKCNFRHGLNYWNLMSENFHEMQCMLLPDRNNDNLLMGGLHQQLLLLNLNTRDEILIPIKENDCAILRQNDKFIVSGDTTGKIAVRDLRTLGKTLHLLDAHSGTLSDFDICGNNLITCGFSHSRNQLACDRFLMVYDLRTLRAVAPMSLSLDPIFLRFLPVYSDSRLVVVSQTGQFQVMEMGAVHNTQQYQLDVMDGVVCTSIDVSSSHRCCVFGDSAGFAHLLSDKAEPSFNESSRPTSFADAVSPLPVSIRFTDELTPLSIIPLPHNDDCRLLSDWPHTLTKKVYRKPLPIDQDILQSMRVVQFIGYAPNSGLRRRNQVPYILKKSKQKADGKHVKTLKDYGAVPKLWRRSVIKQSKIKTDFGSRKFCFIGLEALIPNAYCNVVIQALYHLTSVRQAILAHVCRREFCLACEIAFLFHNLQKNCANLPIFPNNFLRCLKHIPEFTALGLILDDKDELAVMKCSLANLIQSFVRVSLSQISADLVGSSSAGKLLSSKHCVESPKSDSAIEEQTALRDLEVSEVALPIDQQSTTTILQQSIVENVFSSQIKISTRCSRCNSNVDSIKQTNVLNLSYDECACDEQCGFESVVQKAMCVQSETTAWCEQCLKYQHVVQSRFVSQLPRVLILNCCISTEKDKLFWQKQQQLLEQSATHHDENAFWNWVTEYLQFHVNSDINQVENCHCEIGSTCSGIGQCSKYRLKAVISMVKDSACNHLVCCVRIGSKDKLLHSTGDEFSRPAVEIDVDAKNDDEVDLAKFTTESGEQCEEKAEISWSTDVESALDDKETSEEEEEEEEEGIVDLENATDNSHCLEDEWILYNDALVSCVALDDVIDFKYDWKIPCLLFYEDIGSSETMQQEVVNPITRDVFNEEEPTGLWSRRRGLSAQCVPLGKDESVVSGMLVVIDMKFVLINKADALLHSDNSPSALEPSQLAVARVTCIRGDGPEEGKIFLDDYIARQEEVEDYMTDSSGIKPGDLDRDRSSKHLTTWKCTYLKLRYLSDQGVIFVGHGIYDQFRIINISVPMQQLLDTVLLFRLPGNRSASLKFLAAHFLDIKFEDAIPDPCEYAKFVIKLYQKYLQISSNESHDLSLS